MFSRLRLLPHLTLNSRVTLASSRTFARAMSQKTLFEAIKEDHEEVR